MTRILLVGLGRWGANHLRNLHSMPVEVYVAETHPERLEQALKLGMPAGRLTTDYKQFASRVDAVVIVTPAPTHYPLTKEFLELGKDVFVEKPITLNSADARSLTELADRNGRILQVGHIFRYDPANLWLSEAIKAGQFGHLQILRTVFNGFKRPRSDSGILLADAVHFVDLFGFLIGKSPGRVTAITQDFLGRGIEDATLVSLEYEGTQGVIWGTIETNYFFPGKVRELTIVGTELIAVCDLNVAQYKIKTYAHKHLRSGGEFKAVEGAVHQVESAPEEPLLIELRAFLESVETRKKPRADGWSGYESVRIIEAALQSATTRRTVELG